MNQHQAEHEHLLLAFEYAKTLYERAKQKHKKKKKKAHHTDSRELAAINKLLIERLKYKKHQRRVEVELARRALKTWLKSDDNADFLQSVKLTQESEPNLVITSYQEREATTNAAKEVKPKRTYNRKSEEEIAAKKIVLPPFKNADGSDNLEVIEGIATKSAQILKNNNINTFDDLISHSAEEIKSILKANKLYLLNPTTWAAQAKLAKKEDENGLIALQKTIKQGKI